jgi:excisionase family DNA binding protein
VVKDADLLTTEQVMDRLLARPALRRAASTCVLPAVRVGAEWRFRRDDLEAWIAGQTRPAPDTATAKQ